MATVITGDGAYGAKLEDVVLLGSTLQPGTACTVTNYTAHASGAVGVTSNAATDLDTTAAALATLENEVTAIKAVLVAAGIVT
jgi:hypothetical protein